MPSPFCISYGDKKKKLVEYLATFQLIMSDYVKSWSKKWKIINQESRSQKTQKKTWGDRYITENQGQRYSAIISLIPGYFHRKKTLKNFLAVQFPTF